MFRMLRRRIRFLATILVTLACASLGGPCVASDALRDKLLSDARQWVGKQMAIEIDRVEIAAPDARLKSPACPEPLQFDFPFTTRDTVRASCTSSGAQIFVRITILPARIAVLARHDLPLGRVIEEPDLVVGKAAHWSPGAITDRESLLGKTLLRPLKQGEPFYDSFLEQRVQAFRVTRPLKADEAIPRDALRVEQVAPDALPRGMRPARLPPPAARTARDLAPGHILLSSDVKELIKVAVARQALTVGQRLEGSAFEIREIAVAGDEQELIKELPEIENLELTRSLAAGSTLRRSDTKPALLVFRGQQITVQLLTTSGLEVSFAAEALHDARLGDPVSVKNIESGKIIQVLVTGKGTARAR